MKHTNVNTTQSAPTESRGMTEAQIDREFEKVAGELGQYKKRTVTVPGGRPGEEVIEVGLNGRMFIVKCGERVELPEPIAEVLENAGLI